MRPPAPRSLDPPLAAPLAVVAQRAQALADSGARAKKRRLSLGSVKFKLEANKPKLVTLKFSKKVRKLIAKQKKVPVKFTINLKDAAGHTKVIKKTLTLKAPKKR